jgi:hypothetical protein
MYFDPNEDNPGPGAYQPNYKHVSTLRGVPEHTIGMHIADHPVVTPGVGTYNIGRDGNTNPKYSMGKRFLEKLSTTPGPGHCSPEQPGSAPAYTIGAHIEDHPFLTPGVGTYNITTDANTAPAFTMGMRFVRLRDKLKDKRYHAAVKQRPPHRSAGNSPARSRAGNST